MKYVPGLAGVVATKSSVSNIDGKNGILSYRGYSIEELAANSNFEETALLLLFGCLPLKNELNDFTNLLKENRVMKYNMREIMKNLPTTTHPMHMLQVLLSSMASFYPGTEYMRGGQDVEYVNNVSVIIISSMATLVTAWEHMRHGYEAVAPDLSISYAANLLYMLTGKYPEKKWVRLMDACLILHSEHTVNASTFTTRVTASSQANPCSVIASAVASLSGPLHGGANQQVLQMLDEIGEVANVRTYIENRIKNKKVIWGMGHREYATKDPRAVILQKLILNLLVNNSEHKLSKEFEIALKVEEVCKELLAHKGVYPNVDFYSGILYKEMGFLPDTFTSVFAIARSAGWVAHWREQMVDNRIFRPTQLYEGLENLSYRPIEARTIPCFK